MNHTGGPLELTFSPWSGYAGLEKILILFAVASIVVCAISFAFHIARYNERRGNIATNIAAAMMSLLLIVGIIIGAAKIMILIEGR